MGDLIQKVRLYNPPHWDDSEMNSKEAYEENRSEWFALQEELLEFFEKFSSKEGGGR